MSGAVTIETIARTVFGEARGCGQTGMQRVANVIANRAKLGGWWGSDPAAVCLHPWQFSCWNPRVTGAPPDANFRAMLDADSSSLEYRIALDLARQVVNGTLPDLTDNADSYYALTLEPPAWTRGAVHTVSDGWHSFWRTRQVGHAPSAYRPAPERVSNATASADDLNAAELTKVEQST